jgi:hypothetical protein
MTTSRYPEITDELLSAYIDNAVSEEERALIQRAVLEDASVAWRLATLQETVRLLRNLPVLQAPRSFVLTADQVGQPAREPAPIAGVVTMEPHRKTDVMSDVRTAAPSPQVRKWKELFEGWRRFWRAGSPAWRNAMAASMALLLVTLILPALLTKEHPPEMMLSDAAVPSAPVVSEGALPTAAIQPPDETDATQRKTGETSPAIQPAEAPAEVVQEQAAPEVRSSAMEVEPRATALPAAPEGMALSSPHEDSLFPMMERSMANEGGMVGPYDQISGPSAAAGVAPAAVPPAAPMLPAPMLRESADALTLQTAPQPSESAAAMAVTAAPLDEAQSAATPETGQATDEVAPTPASEETLASAEIPESAEKTNQREATASLEESEIAPLVEKATTTSAMQERQASTISAAAPTPQGSTAGGFLAGASLSTVVGTLLPWLRLGSALAFILFGLLWWRSRRI